MEMTLDKFCSKFLLSAVKETSLLDLKNMMEEVAIRHIPIVSNGRPIGIISDRDLRFFINHDLLSKYCAEEIMIPDPYCVPGHTPIKEVIDKMLEDKIGSVILINPENEITGIFTNSDALKAFKLLLQNTL